jgi:hypothetical protein
VIAELYANLGWFGMTPSELYANLGLPGEGDRVIGTSADLLIGKRNLPQMDADHE